MEEELTLFFEGDILSGRYRLIKTLSHGGMGAVWLAEDSVLSRIVAIKTVNLNMIESNPNVLMIFHDEAKIGASLLGHPHVVAVLDYGTHRMDENKAAHFIAMEYIEGINVATFINQVKPIIDEETYYNISLLIASEMGKAIDYAHKRGILHRDIKPLNVFISKYGITKVGDFGLARLVNAMTRTHTVSNFSSPSYCAPEQWKNEKYETTSDIYQFGCTLFHLFTGKYIFEKPVPALIYAHLNEKPRAPKDLCPYMQEELSTLILEMVSKEGNDRPSLWQLNDILAKELHKVFKFYITVDKDDKEAIDKICEVTDGSGDALRNEGELMYFDFNDILSEALQLILNDITTIHITASKESEKP